VRAGFGWISELLAKIVHSIERLAPLALALSCKGPTVEPIANEAPGVVMPETDTVERPDEPKPLGQFTITFYYVIGEDEVPARSTARTNARRAASPDGDVVPAKPANDNESETLATTAELPAPVTLYESDHCQAIADVSREFASQLAIQGTGKLHDGRVLNIWGACKCGHSPCFRVTKNQWGSAGSGRPLQPFRTVAVDPRVVKLGTLLYVPLLEGRTMPGRAPWGGFVHDGCVVADDTGGHIDGNRLDLFVGRKGYFIGLSGTGNNGGSHAWARHVPVFDGSTICERKGQRVARKRAAI
jgi:3D (Asp-Asp-Asp) domain-containing protein